MPASLPTVEPKGLAKKAKSWEEGQMLLSMPAGFERYEHRGNRGEQ
jgi:hypothetical protein